MEPKCAITDTKPLQAAREYREYGFAVTPCRGKDANVVAGWQKAGTPPEDDVRYWGNGYAHNIGIVTGKASGNLVDIDRDCDLPRRVEQMFLFDTLMSGRTKRPYSHFWYYVRGEVNSRDLKDCNGAKFLEVRADGRQTVVFPSIHPDDSDQYKWHGKLTQITTVDADDLNRAINEYATALLLAIHMPPTGGRHDYAMAAAGYLLRDNRLDSETVERILLGAWHAAAADTQGRTVKEVQGTVWDTVEKLGAHEKVIGGGELNQTVEKLPKQIARIWGWTRGRGEADSPVTSSNTGGGTPPLTRQELTDVGNAARFVAQHGRRVRWCPSMKSYLVWDDKRWAQDDCEEVVRLAQETARSIHHEAASAEDKDTQRRISRWAVTSQNASRINAMLSQARPHIAIRMERLDADPWLLNCQNGTVDLRTGDLHPHDPADLMTRLVPVAFDKDAHAPRFEKFLQETLVEDDVIAFLQRFAGYSLTGDTRERAMAILWGAGKNGKSTLVELIHDVLGDYAQNTDVETVLMKRHSSIGNEVAALKGARFVSCSEVEKGRRLAESKVKQLTGRDTVTARYLFAEPFNFKPEFKLWMSTNNKPEIRGTDDAIWDRIRLVPFTQRFEGSKCDPKLPEKLREELPGVLAWLVAGCLAWQRDGLGEPERVTSATKEYRSEMDSLAAFIDECCVAHKDATAPFKALYETYVSWCEESGEIAEKKRSFGNLLSERGYLAGHGTGNVAIRHGIGLRTDREPPPDGRRDVNSGGEQVNHEGVSNSSDEPDNTSPGENEVNSSGEELISETPENTCKTVENAEGVNQVNEKSTTLELKSPREGRIGKSVNYVNSLTPPPPEGARQKDQNEPEALDAPSVERARELLRRPRLAETLRQWQNAPEGEEKRDRFRSVAAVVAVEAGDRGDWEPWFIPVAEAVEHLREGRA